MTSPLGAVMTFAIRYILSSTRSQTIHCGCYAEVPHTSPPGFHHDAGAARCYPLTGRRGACNSLCEQHSGEDGALTRPLESPPDDGGSTRELAECQAAGQQRADQQHDRQGDRSGGSARHPGGPCAARAARRSTRGDRRRLGSDGHPRPGSAGDRAIGQRARATDQSCHGVARLPRRPSHVHTRGPHSATGLRRGVDRPERGSEMSQRLRGDELDGRGARGPDQRRR